MILNIHGLGGRHDNKNFHQLLRIFHGDQIYSRQIDYVVEEPRALLDDFAAHGPYSLIVGHSLGGFFAYALGASQGCKTVLTNPCIPPHEYMPDLVSDFAHLDEMRSIWEEVYPSEFDCTVIVGQLDDVVNPKRTLELMEPHHRVLAVEAGHSLSGDEYARLFELACKGRNAYGENNTHRAC